MRSPDHGFHCPWIFHLDPFQYSPSLRSKPDDLDPQRLRVDPVLRVFTSTRTHMDTGHLSELDADGCSYGRYFEAGLFSEVHNLYSSAQNNGLDDCISQSVQHDGKIMLSHCLYIRLFFKHHSPHDDGQSYRLLYCFNFLLFNITVYICDLKLR
jgi:hypothetical protein